MSDVIAVKQALAYEDGELVDHPGGDTQQIIRDAARRYVRMDPTLRRLADAVDDLWLEIENHGDVSDLQEAWDELLDAATEVRAALADYLTEETE